MNYTILLSIGAAVVAYYYLISLSVASTNRSDNAGHFRHELRRQMRQKRPVIKIRNKELSFEAGPKRGPDYDPTIGYEPYWKDGNWALELDPDLNGSITPGPNCPYATCPDPFVQFGKLCGRSIKHRAKTFDNYCEMQREDCSGMDDWMIVYRGPCVPKPKTLNWSYFYQKRTAYSYIVWWWYNSPSTIHTTATRRRTTTTTPGTTSLTYPPNMTPPPGFKPRLRNHQYLFRRALRMPMPFLVKTMY